MCHNGQKFMSFSLRLLLPLAFLCACATSSGSASETAEQTGGTNAGGAAGAESGGAAGDDGTGGDAGAQDTAGSGGSDVSGGSAGASAASRCKVTQTTVQCEHNVTKLIAGLEARDVYWQTPVTPPPPEGYPVVLVFQGSLGGPSLTWGLLTPAVPFGGFQQGRLQAMLLDAGFTVVAPAASGEVAWQTNSTVPFELTGDKQVMDTLLASIKDGQYGPANLARMYATGISSGGYMTSRMAVSYPGVFRALAIQSASYATCVGAACVVPALPKDHPPTLFLHGQLDTTVPLYTAQLYHDALQKDGIETKMVVDSLAGHEWLKESPERVTEWFQGHDTP